VRRGPCGLDRGTFGHLCGRQLCRNIRSWDGTITTSKLAYTPRYPDASQPPMRVAAAPLDGQPTSPTAGVAFVSYAWGEDGIPFYATGTLFASPRSMAPRRHGGSELGVLRFHDLDAQRLPAIRVPLAEWRGHMVLTRDLHSVESPRIRCALSECVGCYGVPKFGRVFRCRLRWCTGGGAGGRCG
jgi:hypothetical protein